MAQQKSPVHPDTPPPMPSAGIRVRALRRGFIFRRLIEPGEVFFVESEKDLGKWMERLDQPEPPAADAGDADGEDAEDTPKGKRRGKPAKDQPEPPAA